MFFGNLSHEVLMRSISAFIKKDIRNFEHRLGNFFYCRLRYQVPQFYINVY